MTKRHRGMLALFAFMLIGAGCVGEAEVVNPSDAAVNADDRIEQNKASEDPMKTYEFPGTLPDERIADKQVRITTEKGEIVFTLFAKTAPNTVSNFVYLTEEGYYDGLTFHRREESFVIQGGDPNGNGTGGPGYRFEDELDDEYGYTRGIVAMANAGPNTNGSQFFIMLGDTPLPKAYTVFGEVTVGMDVVDEIVVGDTMTTVALETLGTITEQTPADDDTEGVVDPVDPAAGDEEVVVEESAE
jgi:cyclophilin family peptidyl-prolyl cis-trans isomerase